MIVILLFLLLISIVGMLIGFLGYALDEPNARGYLTAMVGFLFLFSLILIMLRVVLSG